MSKIVSPNDLTSGPNMNLPWRKNFCKKKVKATNKNLHIYDRPESPIIQNITEMANKDITVSKEVFF